MTATASKSNEAQALRDLPDLQEHPDYQPAWLRLQELRQQLSGLTDTIAQREQSDRDGARSKLDREAEQLRTGRKPRSKAEPGFDELLHQRKVLRRAIEQQEREVRQAEQAACSQLAHEVQQQELSHAKRITNYALALRTALADRERLHDQLREKGYDSVFSKIAWVQFDNTEVFSNWLEQAAAEYGSEVEKVIQCTK